MELFLPPSLPLVLCSVKYVFNACPAPRSNTNFKETAVGKQIFDLIFFPFTAIKVKQGKYCNHVIWVLVKNMFIKGLLDQYV